MRPYISPLWKLFSISGPTDWQPPVSGRRVEPRTRRTSYMDYVQTFTKRELRFDSDALRAFAGIVDYMINEAGLKTHLGLPLPTLMLDILWQPHLFLKRRQNFPSWSWAGWKGPILMSRAGQTPMAGVQNIRKRYKTNLAFLARLFLIPSYIYDHRQRSFRLASWDFKEDRVLPKRTTSLVVVEDMPLIVNSSNPAKDYPTLDIDKEWAFDPRSEQLKPIFACLESGPPMKIIPVPPTKSSRMSSQILLFQTLTAHGGISAFDEAGNLCGPFPTAPTRQSSMPTAPCVYVYDRHGSRIGLGWLCDQDLYERLDDESPEQEYYGKQPQSSSSQSTSHQQVEIALLSGPITRSWRHENKGTGLEEGLLDLHTLVESAIRAFGFGNCTHRSSTIELEYFKLTFPGHRTEAETAASGQFRGIIADPSYGVTMQADDDEESGEQDLRYCQAILFTCTDCHDDFGCKSIGHPNGSWYVKERIGLCEIREDVISKLEDIAWRKELLR